MAKSTFVYVTYIRTTPEKLWSALTEDVEFMKQYWFGVHRESQWTAGSSWKMVHPDGRIGIHTTPSHLRHGNRSTSGIFLKTETVHGPQTKPRNIGCAKSYRISPPQQMSGVPGTGCWPRELMFVK